jgi:hypothetical protein
VYGETNKSNTENYREINASNIKSLIKKDHQSKKRHIFFCYFLYI